MLRVSSVDGIVELGVEIGNGSAVLIHDVFYKNGVGIDVPAGVSEPCCKIFLQGFAVLRSVFYCGNDHGVGKTGKLEAGCLRDQMTQTRSKEIDDIIIKRFSIMLGVVFKVFQLNIKDLKTLFDGKTKIQLPEETAAVIEPGQLVHAGVPALKVQEQHQCQHRHEEGGDHDLAVNSLDQQTQQQAGQGLQQHPAHGFGGDLAVAEVCHEDHENLAENDKIADPIQRTAVIDMVLIKVENRPGFEIGKKNQKICRSKTEGDACAHDAAEGMADMLQNAVEQEQCQQCRACHQKEKVQGIEQMQHPQRCRGIVHGDIAENIRACGQPDQNQAGGKDAAVKGKKMLSLKVEHAEHDDQADGKKVADEYHKNTPCYEKINVL